MVMAMLVRRLPPDRRNVRMRAVAGGELFRWGLGCLVGCVGGKKKVRIRVNNAPKSREFISSRSDIPSFSFVWDNLTGRSNPNRNPRKKSFTFGGNGEPQRLICLSFPSSVVYCYPVMHDCIIFHPPTVVSHT